MPKASTVREYPIGVEELLEMIRMAGMQFGYNPKPRIGNTVRLGQSFSLLSFTYPATITVSASATGQGTRAEFLVTNFGWGPIQSRHVNAQLERLLSALERDISRGNPAV
jgi:hypothetical protein